MANYQQQIDELKDQLSILMHKQELFVRDIHQIKLQIKALEEELLQNSLAENVEISEQIIEVVPEITTENLKEESTVFNVVEAIAPEQKNAIPPIQNTINWNTQPEKKIGKNIENFIGENLINKVGILITLIGIVIGVKYSIENELINPLTRVILGYVAGLTLLIIGIKLKAKYLSYSAVLVSGAIAAFYFISFSAYNFYHLLPVSVCFILLLVFTIFAVLTAWVYNQSVIAIIGLVGAYAIPFLLSNNNGNISFLFTYITIINIGILFVSIKKNWKTLHYLAFVGTWLIYSIWFFINYQTTPYFNIGLTFASTFFILFYLQFISYKIYYREKFIKSDIVLILSNSFIFYGLGYNILAQNSNTIDYLGAFTLLNAIVHFIVSKWIFKNKLSDQNLFYLAIGLVLTFITLTIPVQLKGNWITLFWAFEALILFWISKKQAVKFYETLSYPIVFLAFISWIMDINRYTINNYTPIFNVNFLSTLLFVFAFSVLTFIWHKNKENSIKIGYFFPVILLIASYFLWYNEISFYATSLLDSSLVEIVKNDVHHLNYDLDFLNFKNIWLINYSIIFAIILALFNRKKINSITIQNFSVYALIFLIAFFLFSGLNILQHLYKNYFVLINHPIYENTIWNILVRYISYGIVGIGFYTMFKNVSSALAIWVKYLQIYLQLVVLVVLSYELINAFDYFKIEQSYKLGLSIFWGVFALYLIIKGIIQNQSHLRISAMVLFAVTLVKLFFYDIAHLNTIAKTIVFVSLGVLLLVISFLYNKYKHLIGNSND